MAKKDYYEVLGVAKNASDDEIKKAYRTKARKHHPDIDKSAGAEERFKEINEAYQILGDPQKKAAYDQFGHAAFQNEAATGGSGGRYNYSYGGSPFNVDVDFGGFRDPFEIFEEFFGSASPFGSRSARAGSNRGEDLHYEITIPFEQAAFGTEKNIEIPRFEQCGECGGSGAEKDSKRITCAACKGQGSLQQATSSLFGNIITSRTCSNCDGAGQVPEKKCSKCKGEGRFKTVKTTTIKIPAGVDDGDSVRFPGLGSVGEKGGGFGDLYLTIRVANHKDFKRSGFNVYYEQHLNFAQAALGAEIMVPTLDGLQKLKIPEGTQTGTEFKLSGKGIKHGGSRGDHLVQVKIITPKKLSQQQKEALRKLEQ